MNKTCPHCYKDLPATIRSNRIYCSNSCKSSSYIDRKIWRLLERLKAMPKGIELLTNGKIRVDVINEDISYVPEEY